MSVPFRLHRQRVQAVFLFFTFFHTYSLCCSKREKRKGRAFWPWHRGQSCKNLQTTNKLFNLSSLHSDLVGCLSGGIHGCADASGICRIVFRHDRAMCSNNIHKHNHTRSISVSWVLIQVILFLCHVCCSRCGFDCRWTFLLCPRQRGNRPQCVHDQSIVHRLVFAQ
jgi:hypothetical protein